MSFDFNNLSANAGSDGIIGPFINWQAKAGQHASPQTWTLRQKTDDNETVVSNITDNFKAGVVFDYNTIKLGWEKWAPMGQRNEIAWAPTPNLQAFQRPSNDKRTNEMGRQVFVWQKVFTIRVAVAPDLAGSWHQSSFGAMCAFEAFIEQLKVAGPQHPGKLPLVQFAGVQEAYGGSSEPVLAIADWKDAPACLKQDMPGVSAMNAGPATQAPAPQPAAVTPLPTTPATPAATAAVPAAGTF
jgi:hypothetical protein